MHICMYLWLLADFVVLELPPDAVWILLNAAK